MTTACSTERAWSSRLLSRLLLHLLIQVFVPKDAPVVVGIDETIERRRGAKIAAKGIYRDPVRSSKSFFVKTSGLRWVCLMLLAPIPWADLDGATPLPGTEYKTKILDALVKRARQAVAA